MNTLTKKDMRILNELDMDARQSISRIAKKVGLSKEVVNYRIKQLENKGIINGYYAIIDHSLLGYTIYRLLLKFNNVSPKIEQDMVNFAKKNPGIGWVGSLQNKWDMVLAFWAKDLAEFNDFYIKFKEKFGRFIIEKQVTIGNKIHHFKFNFLHNSNIEKKITTGGKKPLPWDQKDKEIMKLLSANARMPVIDIANKLHLTSGAIKYRLKQLEKAIMGYRAMIDFSKLGYTHYKIFLFLNNHEKKTEMKLATFLALDKRVIYITEAIGNSDLEFEIFVKNQEELSNFIRKLREEFPEVIRDYLTILTAKEHYINYFPV